MSETSQIGTPYIAERLTEAGRVLLCLPGPKLSRGMVLSKLIAASSASYGHRLRITPDRFAIDRAYQVVDWLRLMPNDGSVNRRLLEVRMLTCPITGRPLYSWRRIAGLLKTDHKTVQRWHAAALKKFADLVAAELDRGSAQQERMAA